MYDIFFVHTLILCVDERILPHTHSPTLQVQDDTDKCRVADHHITSASNVNARNTDFSLWNSPERSLAAWELAKYLVKSSLGDHGKTTRRAQDADLSVCLAFIRFASKHATRHTRSVDDDIYSACETLTDVRNAFAHAGSQQLEAKVSF